jgi:DNA polymerase III alpha subunit
MNNLQIIPIHTHTSSGSLLDSILTVDQYVSWAKENNIKAIGTANHGSFLIV